MAENEAPAENAANEEATLPSKPEEVGGGNEASAESLKPATISEPKVFVLEQEDTNLYESSDDEPYDGPVKYFKIR